MAVDGLLRAARPGGRPDEVAGAGRRRVRPRLPDQDPAGVPDPAAAGRRVRGVRADDGCAGGSASWLSPAVAMVVSGGWWVAIVELWPASSRPYIGGSQDNSFLELTFGYNGFGRITGNETGSVGGGGGGGGGGGSGARPASDRMFNSDIGGQIAWLLPAALHPAASPGCGSPGGRQRTDPPGRVPGLGRLAADDRRWSSASWPASSTSTTPWRWPPTSRRVVGMGATAAVGAAAADRWARAALAGDGRAAPAWWSTSCSTAPRLAALAAVAGAGRRSGRRGRPAVRGAGWAGGSRSRRRCWASRRRWRARWRTPSTR